MVLGVSTGPALLGARLRRPVLALDYDAADRPSLKPVLVGTDLVHTIKRVEGKEIEKGGRI